MNRKITFEDNQLTNTSISITNASNPRKEKILLKPIDLTNKIKNMIDNLERISAPVVGDFYINRKKKKLTKTLHPLEINKNKKRNSIFKVTQKLDKEKHVLLENHQKTNFQSNSSKHQENKNITSVVNKSENTTDDIHKDFQMKTKSIFKNSFFFSPQISNFTNSTHFHSKSPTKMKTGTNFTKTSLKLKNTGTINKIETDALRSSLTNSNITRKYLLNSNREQNQGGISKLNFKLPSLNPQNVTNFSTTNSHNNYHRKFNSTISQHNASTQFSDFFQLTNIAGNKSTTTSNIINLNSDSIIIDKTLKNKKSKISNKIGKSTLQKLSSFQLKKRGAYEDPNFSLNSKDKLIEFVETCNEENKISQYAYDVMGKFFKTSYPDRPLRQKFSAEQIEKDDMFRMENAAKKYFVLYEKGLFISEDYGINELLNFTRRITGLHPTGSYKFRKILGDRVGLDVLHEGNELRLVTLQQPPDMKYLKRNEKFTKQHENIVNHLDRINSKKKSLKKREKDYEWKYDNSLNIISS